MSIRDNSRPEIKVLSFELPVKNLSQLGESNMLKEKIMRGC